MQENYAILTSKIIKLYRLKFLVIHKYVVNALLISSIVKKVKPPHHIVLQYLLRLQVALLQCRFPIPE